MNDLLIGGAIVVGGVLLLKMMRSPTILATPSAVPPSAAPNYGGYNTPTPPASNLSGYGSLAAGIGQGIGGLFNGISSLVNVSNQGSGYDAGDTGY